MNPQNLKLEIDRLIERTNDASKKRESIDNCIEVLLELYNAGTGHDRALSDSIHHLRELSISISADLIDITAEYDELKAKCTHDWYYTGHGHCWDYYACRICGEVEER